jgi:hypothetical protein
MLRARLDGLYAAAIAAGGLLALYLPIYAGIAGTSVVQAPLFDIALQAIIQGLLTAIVALLLGVHITGIYIVDDDGIHIFAGPFESETTAPNWLEQPQRLCARAGD